MNETSRELASIALRLNAIKLSPQEPFTWASGYQMPIYNDNRLLLSEAKYRALVAKGFVSIIEKNAYPIDVVAGTATAGIPHATTLADKLGKPLVYIRSEAKGHGLKNKIEGVLRKNQNVIVIEDLVSTGGSSLKAVEGVREAGGVCHVCLSIFNYGLKEAEDMFKNAGCSLRSLLTFETLLEVATEENHIDRSDQDILKEWRKDPFGWGEARGFPRIEKNE